MGRWLTRDPIGYEGSQWNLYAFSNSDPLTGLDPLGLKNKFTGKGKFRDYHGGYKKTLSNFLEYEFELEWWCDGNNAHIGAVKITKSNVYLSPDELGITVIVGAGIGVGEAKIANEDNHSIDCPGPCPSDSNIQIKEFDVKYVKYLRFNVGIGIGKISWDWWQERLEMEQQSHHYKYVVNCCKGADSGRIDPGGRGGDPPSIGRK
jgi:hypothetical protein